MQMSLRLRLRTWFRCAVLWLLNHQPFTQNDRNDNVKMGREGVEPSRCLHRRILSPLRLPIPPSPRRARQRILPYFEMLSKREALSLFRCIPSEREFNAPLSNGGAIISLNQKTPPTYFLF